ncbi:MAG: hypothetical protein VKK62_07160 [Synechococcaceae cyanobacterium]|nr:hypothetical protein [Synechococcaceae cyanobacterium]
MITSSQGCPRRSTISRKWIYRSEVMVAGENPETAAGTTALDNLLTSSFVFKIPVCAHLPLLPGEPTRWNPGSLAGGSGRPAGRIWR